MGHSRTVSLSSGFGDLGLGAGAGAVTTTGAADSTSGSIRVVIAFDDTSSHVAFLVNGWGRVLFSNLSSIRFNDASDNHTVRALITVDYTSVAETNKIARVFAQGHH